jgi:hypothetical protein
MGFEKMNGQVVDQLGLDRIFRDILLQRQMQGLRVGHKQILFRDSPVLKQKTGQSLTAVPGLMKKGDVFSLNQALGGEV